MNDTKFNEVSFWTNSECHSYSNTCPTHKHFTVSKHTMIGIMHYLDYHNSKGTLYLQETWRLTEEFWCQGGSTRDWGRGRDVDDSTDDTRGCCGDLFGVCDVTFWGQTARVIRIWGQLAFGWQVVVLGTSVHWNQSWYFIVIQFLLSK